MLMRDEIAGLGRRSLAVIVDMMVVSLAMGIALREIGLSRTGTEVFRYLIMLAYSTVFLSTRGQTPGKMLLRLRVIGGDGGTVTPWQAFCRAAVKWTPILGVLVLLAVLTPSPAELQQMMPLPEGDSSVPTDPDAGKAVFGHVVAILGAGMLFGLVLNTRRHPDRQALHDRRTGTFVVRVL